MDKNKTANKICIITVLGNVLLAVLKFLAGSFGNSSVMISDAFHSLSDVSATFIAWLGVKLSLKGSKYKKTEYAASFILGIVLLSTSACIGISGVKKIISKETVSPDIIALIMAGVSILAKEIMFRYTMHYAVLLKSSAFKAEAFHHRADALASVGALTGIGGAMLGYSIFEPISSIIISFLILKISFDIIKKAIIKIKT